MRGWWRDGSASRRSNRPGRIRGRSADAATCRRFRQSSHPLTASGSSVTRTWSPCVQALIAHPGRGVAAISANSTAPSSRTWRVSLSCVVAKGSELRRLACASRPGTPWSAPRRERPGHLRARSNAKGATFRSRTTARSRHVHDPSPRDDHDQAPGRGAGVSPWRRMASPMRSRSGGPPEDSAKTAATSRK